MAHASHSRLRIAKFAASLCWKTSITLGEGDGCGLGLSVVKSLVEGMRGEVLFEGESPAAGASKPFKVNLRFPIVKTISGEHVVQVDVDPKVQEDVQTDQV